jgi:hypothetical protein
MKRQAPADGAGGQMDRKMSVHFMTRKKLGKPMKEQKDVRS